VTVSFTCQDQAAELSGIASCTTPQTLAAEGADQEVKGEALDHAGNMAGATHSVSIDKTKPTISGTADRAANSAGWYDDEVTVSFTCGDALSGIADCTSPVTVGEGAGEAADGTAIDAADNAGSATVSGINIDVTAPTITGTPTSPPTEAGWYNHDVVVNWTCADQVGLSGLADGACPAASTITGQGEDLAVTASVGDRAGNEASNTVSGIRIDRVAPTTSASAPTAWVNKATVTMTATDGGSGVATTFYGLDGGAAVAGTSLEIGDDGTHTVKYWSVDKAGNIEPAQTVTVRIDGTPPTIQWPGGPADGATYAFGTVPPATTCTATDATSGVGGCTVSGYGTTVGQHTMTATATDAAGNKTTENRACTVKEAYTLKGFYQPVATGQVLNTLKGGSTVPLKFEVFAGTKELTDTATVASFTARSMTCSATLPTDDLGTTGTAIGTSLRYDGEQFHQNWQTPKTAGICYQVKVTTTDGSSISALFKLK
jgi:large repetitive protein